MADNGCTIEWELKNRLKSFGHKWKYLVILGYVISFKVEKHNSSTLFYLVNVQFTHFNEYHMQQNPGSTPLLTQETTATFLFPKATTLKII